MSGEKHLEIRSFEAKLDQPGVITGYASVFNRSSLDLGGFAEQIRPGAFKRSLHSKANIFALRNHNRDRYLGSTATGNVVLQEDEQGLAFRLTLPGTTDGNDLRTLMSNGELLGCSFGFVPVEIEWDLRDQDLPMHIVKVADLREISVGVMTPAYVQAKATLRSLELARGQIVDRDSEYDELEEKYMRLRVDMLREHA